jgi:hypothetical protein
VIALPLGLLAALAAEFAAILRGYRSRAGSWAVALENAFMGAAR